MVPTIPKWIWQTKLYVVRLALAKLAVHDTWAAVLGRPKPAISAAEAMRPESATVDFEVMWFTPFPPELSNSRTSVGAAHEKSNGLVGGLWLGVAGVSVDPT